MRDTSPNDDDEMTMMHRFFIILFFFLHLIVFYAQNVYINMRMAGLTSEQRPNDRTDESHSMAKWKR